MGFWIMIFSFIFGIMLVSVGIGYRKKKMYSIVSSVIGILFIIFSIYLALPK